MTEHINRWVRGWHLVLRYTGWFKNMDSRACTSCRRYGLYSKQHLNTRQTVGCGIPTSLLALPVDLCGLRQKLSWIRLTFSSDARGRPELLPLHRQPICSNALPRWRLNVETKTKHSLHGSWPLSLKELTNAKNLGLRSSHFALNCRCCMALR